LIIGEQVLVFGVPQFLDNCLGFGNPCSSLGIIAPQIIEECPAVSRVQSRRAVDHGTIVQVLIIFVEFHPA
jgi:hypothetical protein